jgi:glycosyltransferase involved in cell wall biosynthesis
MNKRVLLILPGLDLGGTEVCVMNYLRGGMPLDFVVQNRGGHFEEEARALGAEIFTVAPRTKGLRQNILAMRRLYKANRQYDTVIVCTEHAFAFIEMLVAWWCGVKVRGAWSHFSDYTGGKGHKRRAHFLARPLLRLFANRWLACTRESGEWLFGSHGVKLRSFHIIPNAIDPAAYAFDKDIRLNLRNELRADEGTLLLGIIGRLAPVKNHAFALEVFVRVLKREPAARLFIIGDGEEREALKKQSAALGITGSVTFTGAVENTRDWYCALDVVLLPSLHEGLPMVAVEAQAAGVPVLLSDTLSREVAITSLARYVRADITSWVDAIFARLGAPRDGEDSTVSEFSIGQAEKKKKIAVSMTPE